MATLVETLSRALEMYYARYLSDLNTSSKRNVDKISSNWNQLNALYDIVSTATSEDNDTRAQDALDEMVAILNAEGIVINTSPTPPLAIGVTISPSLIAVPTDFDGSNPDFSNAFSDILITEGRTDKTSTWAYAISSVSNCLAEITTPINRVSITDITDDSATVGVTCTKAGYSDLVISIGVVRQKHGEKGETGDPSAVDDVTIEVNGSLQLAVKDDGIDIPQLDTDQLFKKGNALEVYKIDISGDDCLVPTNIRRPFGGLDFSLETPHSLGYGSNNITLGNGNLLGPDYIKETTPNRNTYNIASVVGSGIDVIWLDDSYGDLTSEVVVGNKIIVYYFNYDYTDERRYYWEGTIDSAAFNGSHTLIYITPDFDLDVEIQTYLLDLLPSPDVVATQYEAFVGPIETGSHDNVVIGKNNLINGQNNVVIGRGWEFKNGPDVFAGSNKGNILIGNGDDNMFGDANILITPNIAYNSYTTIDSRYNTGIGSYLQIGNSGDINLAQAFGCNISINSTGSTVIGNGASSQLTNGELVFGSGDTNRKAVLIQLYCTVPSTSFVTLQTYNGISGIVDYFTTPSNIGIPSNTLFNFQIDLIGVLGDSGRSVYTTRLIGAIKNVGGTTTLIGTITEDTNYLIDEIGNVEYSITADDTNDELLMEARKTSGTPSQSIKFTATVTGQFLTY